MNSFKNYLKKLLISSSKVLVWTLMDESVVSFMDPFNQIYTSLVKHVDHRSMYNLPPEFCMEVTQGCEMQLAV